VLNLTTHYKLDLLRFYVIRISGILLIIMSFSYYVFAHGTCSSFDTDVVKCEILSQKAEPCSDAPHANDTGKADTSVHACGCANTFVAVVSHATYETFPKIIFGSLKFDFESSDFSRRIERPPITQS
jgi:hypothetical protein